MVVCGHDWRSGGEEGAQQPGGGGLGPEGLGGFPELRTRWDQVCQGTGQLKASWREEDPQVPRLGWHVRECVERQDRKVHHPMKRLEGSNAPLPFSRSVYVCALELPKIPLPSPSLSPACLACSKLKN
jgi:hypothetical protein